MAAATGLPGDTFRYQHDSLKFAIAELAQVLHIPVIVEVTNLFRDCFTPAMLSSQTWKIVKKQLAIPDLSLRLPVADSLTAQRFMLAEVKTLHMGDFYYSALNHNIANSLNTHNSGVEARSRKVQTDILSRLRIADRKYHGNISNNGPFMSRLSSFGSVKGIVTGAFGEMSTDLKALLRLMAKVGVCSYGKFSGAPTTFLAESALFFFIRSHVAMVCLRAKADLILDRIEFLVPTAGASRRGPSAVSRLSEKINSDFPNSFQNVYFKNDFSQRKFCSSNRRRFGFS